jgi:hypothetical protein
VFSLSFKKAKNTAFFASSSFQQRGQKHSVLPSSFQSRTTSTACLLGISQKGQKRGVYARGLPERAKNTAFLLIDLQQGPRTRRCCSGEPQARAKSTARCLLSFRKGPKHNVLAPGAPPKGPTTERFCSWSFTSRKSTLLSSVFSDLYSNEEPTFSPGRKPLISLALAFSLDEIAAKPRQRLRFLAASQGEGGCDETSENTRAKATSIYENHCQTVSIQLRPSAARVWGCGWGGVAEMVWSYCFGRSFHFSLFYHSLMQQLLNLTFTSYSDPDLLFTSQPAHYPIFRSHEIY